MPRTRFGLPLAIVLQACAVSSMADPLTHELETELATAAAAVETLLQEDHLSEAQSVLAAANVGASELPDRHPGRLRIELARARVLAFQDNNQEALALREALQPRVGSAFGASSDESFWNRLHIANLELELGHWRVAAAELERLRDSIYRERTAGSELRNFATRALADALALLDRERDALALLDALRAELGAAYSEDDRRVIDVDEKIARIRIRLDQLEPALQDAARVFLWRNKHLGFSSNRTLQACWTLAVLYKEVGRYETARALIRTALSTVETAGASVSSRLTLKMRVVLGDVEGALGRTDAAEDILRSTWRDYVVLTGSQSIDAIRAMLTYALLLAQNRHLERVCPALFALDARGGAGPLDLQIRAFSRLLSGLCRLREDGSSAANLRALTDMQSAWDELKERDGAGSHALYALSTLAWANYRCGNRRAAKALLQQLVDLTERSRVATPFGSYVHDYWVSRWITERRQRLGYRNLALLYAQDGDLDQAMRIVELGRDRELGDRFAMRARLEQADPSVEASKLRALNGAIQAMDEQIALQTDIVEKIQLESRRTLAVAERDDYLRRGAPVFDEDVGSAMRPFLAPFRRLLPEGTALASLQHCGEHWWAMLLTRQAPARYLRLDREPDLDAAVAAWLGPMRADPIRAWPSAGGHLLTGYARPAGARGAHLDVRTLGERIGRAVLAPLIAAAPGVRRLVIAADDGLSGIPFSAVPVGGALALDRLDIAYVPSLATYRELAGRAAHAGSWDSDLLTIAADPTPGAPPKGDVDPGRTPYAGSLELAIEYAAAHPLSYAGGDVQAAFDQTEPAKTVVLRGAQATKSALLAASADGTLARYRFVHLAAHAFPFPDAPERSLLVLNGDREAADAAQVLTAAELADLTMDSQVLVLAGCGTGIGPHAPGQGQLGFAFAALAAGNRAAVLTLWKVADDLTARFMGAFFRRLRSGQSPWAALAGVQRDFAHGADPRARSPNAWAAFVLYGAG